MAKPRVKKIKVRSNAYHIGTIYLLPVPYLLSSGPHGTALLLRILIRNSDPGYCVKIKHDFEKANLNSYSLYTIKKLKLYNNENDFFTLFGASE